MFYSSAKKEHINKLVYYFLSSLDMESFNTGAALPSMTTSILSGIKMLVPTNPILRTFDENLDATFAEIDCLNEQNAALAAARDRLLPRLISGKIRV